MPSWLSAASVAQLPLSWGALSYPTAASEGNGNHKTRSPLASTSVGVSTLLKQGQAEASLGFEIENSLSLRDCEPCGYRLGAADSHFPTRQKRE